MSDCTYRPQGHTRFATSSICNLDGCHPHQWMPKRPQMVWRRTLSLDSGPHFVGERASIESFITHNGDLDCFTISGSTYALGDVQSLLEQLLGQPMPSESTNSRLQPMAKLSNRSFAPRSPCPLLAPRPHFRWSPCGIALISCGVLVAVSTPRPSLVCSTFFVLR